MNIKEGFKRIYIVLSVIWATFFIFIGFVDNEMFFSLIIGVLIPIVIYFVVKWILKGFENG